MEQMKVFDEKFQTLIKDGVYALNFVKEEPEAEIMTRGDEWAPPNPNNLSCSYCRIEFDTPTQQREHYKLDWHRYNLKQSLSSRAPISEEEFSAKTDDVSSISGSESDEEEDTLDSRASAQGKVFFKNGNSQVFEIYRCLLVDKKAEIDDGSSQRILGDYFKNNRWAVIMLGGGHFAGAIFEGTVPIIHKTFHCYTVRAGQGGAQSSRDNQSAGSQPKSAGASLRRYNEMSLNQHVKNIVDAWRSEMAKCSLIMLRAAGPYNKSVLFGGKIPLIDKTDPRLRSIPFSTRRATFTEVKRVHNILSSVSVHDSVESALKLLTKQKSPEHESKRNRVKTIVVDRAKSREATERPLPASLDEVANLENKSQNLLAKMGKQTPRHCVDSNEEDLDVTWIDQEFIMDDVVVALNESLREYDDSLTPEERKRKKKKPKKSKAQKLREQEEMRRKELYDIVSNGDVDRLMSALKPSNEELNDVITDDGNTLLHVASMCAQLKIVEYLLEHDADLCAKNNMHQTPYTCTQNKDVRDAFRNFARDHPDKYNYNKAHIPINTVPAEELAEKKRLQKKAKREKEKVKKKEEDVKRQEQSEKDRFLQLSDREKRALAAERRILSQSGKVISRCFLCASDMAGKVPFEYAANRFCSIECLKAHRSQHPVVLS